MEVRTEIEKTFGGSNPYCRGSCVCWISSRSLQAVLSLRGDGDFAGQAGLPDSDARRGQPGDPERKAWDSCRVYGRSIMSGFREKVRDELIEYYCIIKQPHYWACLALFVLGCLGWLGAQYAGCLVLANVWLFWLPWVSISLPVLTLFGVTEYIIWRRDKERTDSL